jgi:uncharacterized protein YggT (Ycf19 family)
MEDQRMANDEARRIAQHERIKEKLEKGVHARIAQEAAQDFSEQADVESVAAELKRKAAVEVIEVETDLDRARRLTRVSQVVDYVFFVLYGLIGLEIILDLFGARQGSGFKRFLDAVTLPALGPFRGLLHDPAIGSVQFMFSYLMALVVYVLLHMASNGLLRLLAQRKAHI